MPIPALFFFDTFSFWGLFVVVLSVLIFFISEHVIRRFPTGSILGGLLGILLGAFTASIISYPLRLILSKDTSNITTFYLFIALILAFMLALSRRCQDVTLLSIKERFFTTKSEDNNTSILDTSVLIDGRIADIIDAGFITGKFIIPQFIIQELQYIADSPESVRRMRGRRGLDTIKKIQKMSHIKVEITQDNYPNIKDVDSKIIAHANSIVAKIITNDYNLQKVAHLQGLVALNINELANILKTLVIPGEKITLFIAKEGKEQGQGVAYLDDGTMVVVENGRRFIGKTIDLEVTSILQTPSGRMIFARAFDERQ